MKFILISINFCRITPKIAAHKFLSLFYQIASRISTLKSNKFQEALHTLIEHICVHYPYHSLYQVIILWKLDFFLLEFQLVLYYRFFLLRIAKFNEKFDEIDFIYIFYCIFLFNLILYRFTHWLMAIMWNKGLLFNKTKLMLLRIC